MYREPEIFINGENIGSACSMTIRVAIECFASDLIENGLGDDEHGKLMKNNYLNIIDDIRKVMGLNK